MSLPAPFRTIHAWSRPAVRAWTRTIALGVLLLVVVPSTAQVAPQGLAFSYQGRLTLAGAPVQGTRAMMFRLFDTPSGGLPFRELSLPTVNVDAGLFLVDLDYGAGTFLGQQLWLEVVVDGQVLSPRQRITSAPYALYALEGNPGPIGPPGPAGPKGDKGDPVTIASGNGIVITGDAATAFTVAMSGSYAGNLSVSGDAATGGDASVAGTATIDTLRVQDTSDLGTRVRLPIYVNEWNAGTAGNVALAYCDVGDILIGGGCHKNGHNVVISKMQSCPRGDLSAKPLIATNAGCADIVGPIPGSNGTFQPPPAEDNAPNQAFWVCLYSGANTGGGFAQATCLRSFP